MSIDEKLEKKEEEYFIKFGERFEMYDECTKEYELMVCERCIEQNTPWPKPDEDADY